MRQRKLQLCSLCPLETQKVVVVVVGFMVKFSQPQWASSHLEALKLLNYDPASV